MLIEKIEATVLEVPVDAGAVRHPVLSGDSRAVRQAVLVQVATTSGARGEAYFTQIGVDAAAVAQVVAGSIVPLLKGRDARDIEGAYSVMFGATRRAYWTREAVTRAISVVDAALWDLKGKALGVPLADLWGRCHEELPMIVMTGPWPSHWTVADCAAEAEGAAEQGYAGIKLKVGMFSPFDVAGDAQRVAAIRSALGSDFIIVADANQGWSRDEATQFALLVEALGLAWLEEPCHWETDMEDMAFLRRQTRVPIAAGQMEIAPQHCERLIAAGAIDVCNFDAAVGGGPSAWRAVADHAAREGVAMAQHMEPQVGTHLLSACPTATHVETFGPAADPFYYRMLAHPPGRPRGRCRVPDHPGWGIELDWDFIQRHRVSRDEA